MRGSRLPGSRSGGSAEKPLAHGAVTTTPARRRLSPEARREEILAEAARLVLAEGVSELNMERLGRAAGVSKGLVYAYFPTRTDLLLALLRREQLDFQTRARAIADAARGSGLEATVRQTTQAWLDHVADRGGLIDRLLDDPQVAAAADRGSAREATVAYFGRAIAEHCQLDAATARSLADLLMGLTGAAGQRLRRTDEPRDAMRDLVVRLIFAVLDDFSGRRA